MGQAREAYYNAMRALQGATSMNQGAQFTNIMTGDRGMGGLMGDMQEMQRNQMMREAGHMAEVGGQMLVQAFEHIPSAARARYPQLCVELGQVHVPSIEQMGLGEMMLNMWGGGLVDFAVNMHAQQKIRESMGRLRDCENIVARQEALCEALLAAIHRDGSAAAANLQSVNGQVWQEKVNVFNALRTANGVAPAAADAFDAAFEGARNPAARPEEASVQMHHAAVRMQRAHRGRPRQAQYEYDGGFW